MECDEQPCILYIGMWRNGSRSRLKICRAMTRVGSNPTIPTT